MVDFNLPYLLLQLSCAEVSLQKGKGKALAVAILFCLNPLFSIDQRRYFRLKANQISCMTFILKIHVVLYCKQNALSYRLFLTLLDQSYSKTCSIGAGFFFAGIRS